MNDETERPNFFNLWPSITFINCPHCGTHWVKPRFASKGVTFPPSESESEARESLPSVYCPGCGERLPSIDQLALKEHAIGRSPTFGKPFIGTVSGIRRFLEQSRGAQTRLWTYHTSHSYLTLKIDSGTDKTHAFVVCMMTGTVILPKLYWNSYFALEPVAESDYWSLKDESAHAEIQCIAIGIFHNIDHLW